LSPGFAGALLLALLIAAIVLVLTASAPLLVLVVLRILLVLLVLTIVLVLTALLLSALILVVHLLYISRGEIPLCGQRGFAALRSEKVLLRR
jgi:hypothetical protein